MDVRRPLLAMAQSADHLVVARHDYSDTTLDALATPGIVLRLRDLVPPPRPNPGPRLYALLPWLREQFAASMERKQPFIDEIKRGAHIPGEEGARRPATSQQTGTVVDLAPGTVDARRGSGHC
ncbi:hypothetical protein ACFU8Q_35875 [Streptomyces sp. NPDC057543]|uniref:hypothetical protein n=1 Tax=Streptomyces sp. NPDC057543 TaxID=3346163 RepID=UPI003697CB3E